MEKQILRCLLVLMVVVSLLMSCGEKEAGWKGTITTEDGITVIKNPKEPVYARPVLSLERNLVKEDILLYNSIYDLYYYARYELGNENLELNCATLAS